MKSTLLSASVHAAILTIVILLGASVPRVAPTPVRYHQTLILPMALPVPLARPTRPDRAVAAAAEAVQVAPARLSIGPRRIAAPAEEAEPRLAALSVSATLDLPAATVAHVVEAAQVKAGVFGSTAGNSAGRQVATASQAGFGTAGQMGAGHGVGRVVTAGFDRTPASRAVATSGARSSVQPAVVKYVARPQYTAEAKEAHVTGEVTVRVCLKADGTVQVFGVTQGLGHGLDEEAERVARDVKFTPELHGGLPVDHDTTVHVTFELN